ncbi:MAG: PQQ-binding-like beta-propeller repeat protein [Candidatus Hydrogenedentes bacterium]|nr:PQQ-binding-like beta-propeller repeat protein [Candidatus Hydrogenedentota bacterium]
MNVGPFQIVTRRPFPWVAQAIELGQRCVCFGDGSRTLRCYDASDFNPFWATALPEKLEGALCRISGDGGIVLAQTHNILTSRGTLLRLDLESGKVLWQAKLPRYSPRVPCVVGQYVFLASDRRIHAYDADSGRLLFQTDYVLASASLLHWQMTGELIAVDVRGSLVAFSSTSLELMRTFDLGLRNPEVFMVCDHHILVGKRDAGIHVFDATQWKLERTYKVPAYSECLCDGDRAYVQTMQDNVDGHRFGSFDRKSGDLMWEVAVPFDKQGPVHSPHPLFVRQGYLWIWDWDGPAPLYALSSDTGEVQRAYTTDIAQRIEPSCDPCLRPGRPFLANGKVYASVADELWCLES